MASILDLFGGGFTPMNAQGPQAPLGFMDTIGQNRNALVGLGLGLMGGSREDPYGPALRGYSAGSANDQNALYRQALLKRAAEEQAYKRERDKVNDDYRERALKQRFASEGRLGLNVLYGRDADNNVVPLQPSATGGLQRAQLPEGVTLQGKEPIKMDAGTHWVLVDPLTRQQIGVIPKNVGGAAAEKEMGEQRGKAVMDLPQIEAQTDQTLKLIDEIRNTKGTARDLAHGSIGGRLGPIGGEQAAYISRVEQLKGQTFLKAYETLKGAGQITEIEGIKAEQAIARLNRIQDPKDFDRALSDLESVVRAGRTRARQKAGVQSGGSGSPNLKQKYGLE